MRSLIYGLIALSFLFSPLSFAGPRFQEPDRSKERQYEDLDSLTDNDRGGNYDRPDYVDTDRTSNGPWDDVYGSRGDGGSTLFNVGAGPDDKELPDWDNTDRDRSRGGYGPDDATDDWRDRGGYEPIGGFDQGDTGGGFGALFRTFCDWLFVNPIPAT